MDWVKYTFNRFMFFLQRLVDWSEISKIYGEAIFMKKSLSTKLYEKFSKE